MHLVKLHEEGFKPEQIKDALKRLPFVRRGSPCPRLSCLIDSASSMKHPAVQRGVEAFKAQTGATFLCLSNSNQVFIDTILKVSPALFRSVLVLLLTREFAALRLARLLH